MVPKRRKDYTDGSPEVTKLITLDRNLVTAYETLAEANQHSFEEECYRTLQGRLGIRDSLKKLPEFRTRHVSGAEGAAKARSIIDAEALRHARREEMDGDAGRRIRDSIAQLKGFTTDGSVAQNVKVIQALIDAQIKRQ